MTTGQTPNDKITWLGNGKSKLDRFTGGKTIDELKSMSNEDRKSLIDSLLNDNKRKSKNPQTSNVESKIPADTKFFDQEQLKTMIDERKAKTSLIKETMHSSMSGRTITQRTAQEPNIRLTENPNKTPKVERQKRSLKVTNHEKPLSASTKSLKSIRLTPNASDEFVSGTVDYTFPNGYDNGFGDYVYAIEIQSDGKILVGGDFGYYYYYGDSYFCPYLVRLNPDGSFDNTFNIDLITGSVYSIAIQPDGKIIVGGNFNNYDDYPSNYIVRINSDGSYDNTFVVGDGFNDYVNDIKIQSDGKIVVGGNFTYYNNIESEYICRLNSNGIFDTSFISQTRTSTTGFDGEVNTIQIQQDGKILVGGWFNAFYINGTQIGSCNYIARLNSDGSYDTTFQIGNGFNGYVNTIALQTDGKIIVGGNFYDLGSYNNTDCNGIVRLNSDGSLESTFGWGVYGEVMKITIQSDGKILVGGYISQVYPNYNDFTSFNADELVRFNEDTTFDYSFYYDELFNSSPWAITLDSEGKIYVGGEFYYSPNDFLLSYFGRLNNTITKYKYIYSVTNTDNFNEKTYSVGSNTLITRDQDGTSVKLRSIMNPSEFVFGQVTSVEYGPYSYGIPQYELIEVYDGYNPWVSATEYNLAYCESLLTGESDYFLVSNLYEIGDIFFVDESFFDGNNFRVRSCFKIVSFDDYDPFNYYSPIPYVPYETCEECVEANGVYYFANSPFAGMYGVNFLSYQYFNTLSEEYPAIIIPTDQMGDTPMTVLGSDTFFLKLTM